MNETKLNSAAMNYFNEPDRELRERYFEDIYRTLREQWLPKFPTIAQSLRTSVADAEAIYEDVLLKVLESYDGNRDFCRLLKNSLRNKRADHYDKMRRHTKRFSLTVDKESDENAATFEIADEFDLELTVIKKKEDQRQLISFLTRNTDAKTTAIVNAFGKHESQKALAEALGFDRKTVRQKLRALAHNFDEEILGELRYYFSA
jgi:RNA polymerase sigma factor (sigma-70 family)